MAGETAEQKGIRLQLSGADDALFQLGEAVSKTDDRRGLFDAVGASLVVSTQDRFEREIGPSGEKWPASLRARLFGGKTLTDTARLVSSLTHNATPDGVEVGTNVIYAAIHQLGGTIRPKTGKALSFATADGKRVKVASVRMPARPFLGIDDDDKAEIIALADDWIGGPFREGPTPNAGGRDVR